MNIYSVYDKRAQTFGTPFAQPSDAHAVRGFTNEINKDDDNNMLSAYPSDFALFKIAMFDMDNGMVTQDNGPVTLPVKLLEAEAAKRPPASGNAA
jgi:hypothetical protein